MSRLRIRTLCARAGATAVVIAALFAAAAERAEATVLYQQAPAGTANTPGTISNVGQPAYDDFRLSDQAVVSSVSWIGRNSSALFQIAVYSAVPGGFIDLPAAAPLYQVTVTPNATQDAEYAFVSHYTVDLGTALLLEADTQYWLSIRTATSSFWGWNGDAVGLSIAQLPTGYVFNNLSLFFTLDGQFVRDIVDVAEPSTGLLFAAGLLILLGLAAARRRPVPA